MIKIQEYKWGSDDNGYCQYELIKEGKVVNSYTKESCFSRLDNVGIDKYDEISIERVSCVITEQYETEFLQYIIDMLKIEASFCENYFTFKNTGNNVKNLLICSMPRLLWEKMWNKDDSDNLNDIIIPLLQHKSKYRNKLARFCDVFSRIKNKSGYLHTGHLWNPNLMKIKYTRHFWKENPQRVNSFFDND